MKVVFCCTGNTCRSPLAQAFFQKKLEENKVEDCTVDSCGIACSYGAPISINSQQVLKDRNINFTHLSQPITIDLVRSADYIITLTKAHKKALEGFVSENKLFSMDDFTGDGDIMDPYGQSQEIYNIVADQIENAVNIIFKKIINK